MSRDDVYLRDMLRAAKKAIEAVSGLDRDTFIRIENLQDIVIRKLIVIGEAARRVSPEMQGAIPSLPWPQIVGMRNTLVHNYDGINLTVIWETIETDLPRLISVLEPFVGIAVRPDLWEGL